MREYLLSSVDRSQSFAGGLSTVDLTGEEADTFFDALASATTRELLDTLYDEPATASELADDSETSLQNVHYHLEKLEAADLIEPVDVVYSSRGREVNVYGPTNRAIVLVTGESSLVGDVKTAIARFVGVVAVLAVGALLVQSLLVGGPLVDLGGPGPAPTGDDAPAPAPTPTGDYQVAGGGGGNLSDEAVDQGGPTAVDDGETRVPTSGTAVNRSLNGTATPTAPPDVAGGNATTTPTQTPPVAPTPTPG